jgi:aspartyl-tRNA(Asn)/glutamyl-tRNA(Gln) amidotransferase subunit B
MSKDEYTPTIGIECHVQLKTKTKLFAAVGNDARQAPPNTLISHICMGLPGALPVLNEKALELAARAAFALNTKPQPFSKFDRKHYFYPDLPKGYQITQYEQPIILGGYLEVPVGGKQKRVGITRVHLEEDAGKNIHPAGADYSLVDLNRAGTPLLEIVSEPEIHSAAEAKAFARELWLIMKYADVTDGDLYHGHVRFDVNISVSKDPSKMGIRSEIKNLNSFRSVEGAVAYEIDRQIELLEKGEKVVQETRGWDEATQKTIGQRGKEEAQDYRYMPEPDIPPIELAENYVDKIKSEMPELPSSVRKRLSKIDLTQSVIEDLLDRTSGLERVLYILDKAGAGPARRATFWLVAQANDGAQLEGYLPDVNDRIIELSEMIEAGQLSSSAAQQVYDELSRTDKTAQQVAEDLNLIQISDESALDEIVTQTIKDNPKAIEDVKKGEAKAIGFLVGQVMAKSKGKANPGLAQQIIKKQLGI